VIRSVQDHLWAFDCEWVPDPRAGRLVYGLPADLPDRDVLAAMWKRGGATAEDPRPFLKTVLCRVVSVAAVQRRRANGEVKLNLLWLPRDPADAAQADEARVVGTFLQALGRHRPQLVGYNSRGADLRILVQRGVALGLAAPEFCRRPDKPWEGVDYFHRDNEWHLDLMEILGGWGSRAHVSLHEIATLSGIPGKFQADGEEVAPLWLDGRLADIVRYNCYDALTTYLVWLRAAHFAGLFDAQQYEDEQNLVRELIMDLAEQPETAFLTAYFDEWERLQALTGQT
jgi:predicted PolB exonuclease-like 3'-5' exonuclease